MIYVVGHLAYDILLYVNQFPKPNSATQVNALRAAFGGAAGNCARVISRLDEDASLISVVGSDFPNSSYDKSLGRDNIDTTFVRMIPDEITSRAYMPIDRDGNEISYFYWGASSQFPKMPVPALRLESSDMIHLATGAPDFNKRIVAKYHKAIVSFDPGYDVVLYSKSDLEFLFERIDFLFVNEHELKNILAKTGGRSAGDLLRHGMDVVVVSEGAKGSTIHTPKNKFRIGSYKTKMVDPTGAGDAYRAAFLAAFTKGKDLQTCARIGAAVASFVVEQPGAQTNVPGWDQALARAKKIR